MPIYEYQCTKCSRVFEYTQSIKDPPKKKCEACKGKLERLISASGFILKGGGWYKDLYSSSKSSSSRSGDGGDKSSSKSDSKSTTASTSETKSEKKTEKK